MGQQQLLLLVLSIVIVGLAVVNGVEAFGENSAKAKQDRQLAAMVRIAAAVDVWRKKPTALGGGQSQSWSNATATFSMLGMTHVPTDAKLHDIPNVGCARMVGSNANNYGAIRIYDVDACPASRTDLSDEDLVARLRIYEDRWQYIFGPDGSDASAVTVLW
ncbi:MAG: hypothetical protein AAF809_12670 [Bacteroidota bacterium]